MSHREPPPPLDAQVAAEAREQAARRCCRTIARQLQESLVPLKDARRAMVCQDQIYVVLRRELDAHGLELHGAEPPAPEAAAS